LDINSETYTINFKFFITIKGDFCKLISKHSITTVQRNVNEEVQIVNIKSNEDAGKMIHKEKQEKGI
jgi:hypothetical protein